MPPDLRPPLRLARSDLPEIYADGCHVGQLDTLIPSCAFGSPASSTVVVLFGDSHAAQWFPALLRLATEHGWRFVSITKSGCPVVDAPIWNVDHRRVYPECEQWRRAALQRIADEAPDLVVVSDSRFEVLEVGGRPVPSRDREDLWDAALGRTLTELVATAGHVALIGDTPHPNLDPPVCLSGHLEDALACATPMSVALGTWRSVPEQRVAEAAGASFIDTDPWVCPTDPCPAIIGRTLVYRDDNHITATFSQALAPYLLAELPPLP